MMNPGEAHTHGFRTQEMKAELAWRWLGEEKRERGKGPA